METLQLTPTNVFPDMGYKFEYFNPFQSQFYPHSDANQNCVVSAPTGSGKTVVAEMVTYNTIKKGKGVIFLAPMRSLVQEKYDDWTRETHPFKKYGISILSGDYKLTESKKKELNESSIVVMTSEMLDSRTRRMKAEGNIWLMNVEVLVVDEAHLIGMWNEGAEPLQERGHKLEAALMRFTKLNQECRIILLSATLPNLPQLGEWLTKLNNKKTEIIVSDYRPQPVDWHLEAYPESNGYGSYWKNKANMFQKALETVLQYPDDMCLCFVHSKTDGRKFLGMVNESGRQAEFHCADLEKGERSEIEKGFRSKKNKVLIATSTMAYGVNLPARRVIILDDKRGINAVHPYDIKQMGGRAGRPGLDPKGDVHWIVGNMSQMECQSTIDNMPIARSQMFDIDVFAFHVVAEIAEGGIKNRIDLYEWFSRCLAHHQGCKVDENWLDSLLKKLIEFKAITIDNEIIKVTQLGRIASWLYQSPFDVYHLYSNFDKIIKDNIGDDAMLAWGWTSIRTNSMSYVPKDLGDALNKFTYEFKSFGPLRGCEAACTGMYLHLKGIESKDLPSSCISLVRNLVFDAERHYQTISLIDSMFAKWDKGLLFKKLLIRVKYGCGWEPAELCVLPKIGKKRAEALVKNNIKSLKSFIKEREKCSELIGETIYENARLTAIDLVGENE